MTLTPEQRAALQLMADYGQRCYDHEAVKAALKSNDALAAENQALEAKVEALTQKVHDYEHELGRERRDHDALATRVAELEAEREAHITTGGQLVGQVRALREALAFYADADSWVSPSKGFARQYDPEPAPAEKDRGQLAAQALTATRPPEAPEAVCVCGHGPDAHGNDGTGHCGATVACRSSEGCRQYREAPKGGPR